MANSSTDAVLAPRISVWSVYIKGRDLRRCRCRFPLRRRSTLLYRKRQGIMFHDMQRKGEGGRIACRQGTLLNMSRVCSRAIYLLLSSMCLSARETNPTLVPETKR